MNESQMGTSSQMRQVPVEILMVLDRSGSMASCADATIIGFNEFLQMQRKSGVDGFISLYQFDTIYEAIYEGRAIATAPLLTAETFQPRGMTALYDAMGRTLTTALARIKEGTKVVMVTVTDGGENASQEYRVPTAIKALIDKAKARDWQCLFIGANQDAVLTASTLGIPRNSSMTYTSNSVGTQSLYGAVGSATASFATGNAKAAVFTDADRKAQEDAAKGQQPGTSQTS